MPEVFAAQFPVPSAPTLKRPHCVSGRQCPLLLACIIALLAAAGLGAALRAADEIPADTWLTNKAAYPNGVPISKVTTNGFESLHAEPVLERYLLVSWSPAMFDTNATVTLFASQDLPRHWLARDWRKYDMRPSGASWTGRPPTDSVHVPLIYFVQEVLRGVTNISPMRIVLPRAAGLEIPSRLFLPFLEGFEHGFDSWSALPAGTNHTRLGTDPIVRSGYSSLKVSLEPGQRFAAIATTRIRGWQLEEKEAFGIRLWLRAKSGKGRAHFALHGDALTTNHVTTVSTIVANLDAKWQMVDLPLASFPGLHAADVDWFTVEFEAPGPIDFLVDDVQLLGPWRLERD